MAGGRPRKHPDDRARRVAQNLARKQYRANHPAHRPVEFMGVDGEGEGRGRNHKYTMLGIGSEHIYNPEGIGAREAFRFAYEMYLEYPEHVFAGFFLGYDFTQILKTLPEGRARMLITEEGIARRARRSSGGNNIPFPVRWDDWELDILAMKRLKFRPRICGSQCNKGCQHKNPNSWLYICDTGSFFQASLMSVINPEKWTEPVVSPEEWEILKAGKDNRDKAVYGPEMIRYNSLENDVLARLLGRLNMGLNAAGVYLKRDQWFGPGQAAQHWLRGTEAPENARLADRADLQKPLECARKAYFGGWFEIFAHGHVPGRSYEYDINSAYPAVAAKLPCLLHGQWARSTSTDLHSDDGRTQFRLVHVRVSGSDSRIGTMLHRHPDGRIVRPYATGGWYWEHELRAAIRCGLISDVQYIESWIYYPCDCPPPLRGLAGLYDYRSRIGKDTPEGKAAKLVYNSVYGKFAQSTGYPRFGNPAYAGLITAGCRTMILDAIASHPLRTRGVLMVATDGVFFTEPHPGLPVSGNLGDWDMTVRENLTLFKPGVYWDDKARRAIAEGKDPAFKARGISARAFARCIEGIDSHFSRWPDYYPPEQDPQGDREGWFPLVEFETGFSMITCRQALARRKWFLAGAVGNRPVKQDADPVAKRHSGVLEGGIYWSRPHRGWSYEPESVPYSKSFGLAGDLDREEHGLTDDGYVTDNIAEIFQQTR